MELSVYFYPLQTLETNESHVLSSYLGSDEEAQKIFGLDIFNEHIAGLLPARAATFITYERVVTCVRIA